MAGGVRAGAVTRTGSGATFVGATGTIDLGSHGEFASGG